MKLLGVLLDNKDSVAVNDLSRLILLLPCVELLIGLEDPPILGGLERNQTPIFSIRFFSCQFYVYVCAVFMDLGLGRNF